MLAIGLLATTILVVVGVYGFLFNASQKSVDYTAGTSVARSELEGQVRMIQTDPKVKTNFYGSSYANETVIASGVYPLNQTNINWVIYAQDLGAVGGSSTYPLKKLRAVTSWWNSGNGLPAASRQGYGTLSVELTRIMMYGDF
jgi:hypothetical protein